MAKQQLLRDANIMPTDEIIASCLGKANMAFVKFVHELKQYDITLMEWRYYKDGKAWLSKGEYKWTTASGINKTTPIFWLSIWEDFFKVSFFFAHSIKEELLNLQISNETKEIIKNADLQGQTMRFMPVIFDVENDSMLCDVITIAKLRKLKMK